MPRKPRPFHNTIVIVCEDTVVTPTYLGRIRAEVIRERDWSDIAIYPVPPSDITTVKNDNLHKSPRKIRAFLTGEVDATFEIEEAHKAVPVRYVREAQLRMLESGYNEGWAVYDLDGHPRQAEAYVLSLTAPKIYLAFSSIAVEHWFLLHYVRDNTAYAKSGDVPIHTYIPDYDKDTKGGIDIYGHIHSHLEIALENAAWLRTINAAKDMPFYSMNPYVDMDLLIKRLYGIEEEISWGNLTDPFMIKNFRCTVIRAGNRWLITVINHSSASIVSGQIRIHTFDALREKTIYGVPLEVIIPGASLAWELELPSPGLLNIAFENYRAIVAV